MNYLTNQNKSRVIALFLATILFFALPLLCQAEMQSSTYKISQDVFSAGGTAMQSTSYVNQSTLGQPTPIGAADFENYANAGGFWHSVATIIDNYPKVALSWLMLLLGEE
jgi:hypothetical protein